jgi:Domain of unknown function (DUF4124)
MWALVAFMVALACLPAHVVAGAYKCRGEDGRITYSQVPCPGAGEAVRIQRSPPTPSAPLEVPQQSAPASSQPQAVGTEGSPTKVPEPAASDVSARRMCGAEAELVSYAPFTRERVEGGTVSGGNVTGGFITNGGFLVGGQVVGGTVSGGRIRKTRCAGVTFRLVADGSRIIDYDALNELSTKLHAVLADGTSRPGQPAKKLGGRERVLSGQQVDPGGLFSGRFCFGTSDFDIVDVQCP